MIRLYYAPGACSLAVHVVLEWVGTPYEAVRADQHAPEYRAINPAGAVPALAIDGDRVLTQADAILHYLARRHPDADLLDDGSLENAAELDRWGSFLTGDLHPAFFPVFTPGRYTTATNRGALDAVVAAGIALVEGKLSLLDGRRDLLRTGSARRGGDRGRACHRVRDDAGEPDRFGVRKRGRDTERGWAARLHYPPRPCRPAAFGVGVERQCSGYRP